jgi:integrase
MKCRYCKNEVEDDSVFCRFCGERLARVRRKKQAAKPTAPKPHQLATGEWAAQVMISGRRQWVKGETEADYYARAEALKAGVLAARPVYQPLTVGQMVDAYIERNRPVLSPSTVKAYRSIRKHRFQRAMAKDVRSGIDWQIEINNELQDVKPKTLANAWRLITAAMKDAEIPVPRVKLPQIPKRERPWLDYEQISTFLAELYETGGDCLIPALLALHGLRRSEILALTSDDIDLEREEIQVHAAEVYNDAGKRVHKETTKSRAGTRTVPILIPALKTELKGKTGRIVTKHPNVIYAQINRVCKSAGLPEVGVHGLRHSFASLAYHLGWSEATTMQVGGWDDLKTVHGVYTHLSALDKSEDVERMKAYFRGE